MKIKVIGLVKTMMKNKINKIKREQEGVGVENGLGETGVSQVKLSRIIGILAFQ